MSSSSAQSSTPNRPDRPRVNGVKNALLWLLAAVVAVFPFPWWW
jgi:hypothetical protein